MRHVRVCLPANNAQWTWNKFTPRASFFPRPQVQERPEVDAEMIFVPPVTARGSVKFVANCAVLQCKI